MFPEEVLRCCMKKFCQSSLGVALKHVCGVASWCSVALGCVAGMRHNGSNAGSAWIVRWRIETLLRSVVMVWWCGRRVVCLDTVEGMNMVFERSDVEKCGDICRMFMYRRCGVFCVVTLWSAVPSVVLCVLPYSGGACGVLWGVVERGRCRLWYSEA